MLDSSAIREFIDFAVAKRRQPPRYETVVKRDPLDTRVEFRVIRSFTIGFAERHIGASFEMDDREMVTSTRSEIADQVMLGIDRALSELDGLEFMVRLLAGDLRLRADTDDDEARVERAALKLMGIVEDARRKRGAK